VTDFSGGEWPRTLDEAVEQLALGLSRNEKEDIARLPEDHLIDLHFGLGARIREEFGLWRQNKALLASCGSHDPDDASMAIVRALWVRLRH
jgi:hypothetical protein